MHAHACICQEFSIQMTLTCRQVCFHGPVDEAIPFFRSLGFDCPIRKDPANFLQEVTTPKGIIFTPCYIYVLAYMLRQHGCCCGPVPCSLCISGISAALQCLNVSAPSHQMASFRQQGSCKYYRFCNIATVQGPLSLNQTCCTQPELGHHTLLNQT